MDKKEWEILLIFYVVKTLRIRIGIGRPTHGDMVSWVTGKFSEDERKKVHPAIVKSVDFMDELMSGTDFERAVSKFNIK